MQEGYVHVRNDFLKVPFILFFSIFFLFILHATCSFMDGR